MSFNEFQWWQAYACLRPLAPDRIDIMESRIVGSLSNTVPSNDWFSKENDAEWCEDRDREARERLKEKTLILHEKLAYQEDQERERLKYGDKTN